MRRTSESVIWGALLVALVAACGTANTSRQTAGSEAPSSSSSSSPTVEISGGRTTQPPLPCPSNIPMEGHSNDCTGSLPVGVNTSGNFSPRLRLRIPENGWIPVTDERTIYTLLPPGGDFNGLTTGGTDKIGIYTGVYALNRRCDVNGQITTEMPGVGHSPAAIAHELSTRPGVIGSVPRAVTIGGLTGYFVKVQLASHWTRHCYFEKAPSVPMIGAPARPSGVNHLLERGVPYRYYFLDYRGSTLAIEVTDIGTDDLDRYDALVHSFQFG